MIYAPLTANLSTLAQSGIQVKYLDLFLNPDLGEI
jgi:hypothetical protein